MRVRAVAVGVAVLCLAAACGSSAGNSRPGNSDSSSLSGTQRGSSTSQITPAAAMQIFDSFLTHYLKLNQHYSMAQNDAVAASSLNQEDAFGAAVGFPRILFLAPGEPGGEHVYVPRLAGYPRWFVGVGTLNGDTNTNAVYVLAQAGASAPWKAVVAVQDMPGLGPGQTPVLDSGGYARAIPAASASFLAPPGQLASLYVQQLNSGSGHLFNRPFGGYPLTPGGNPVSETNSAKFGWRVNILWQPYSQPAYALAISGGRAIVIFTMDQQYSWTAISSHPKLPSANLPAVGQDYYAPWPQFARLAHVKSVHEGLRISLETIYSWLAVDLPSHSPGGAVVLSLGDDGMAGATAN